MCMQKLTLSHQSYYTSAQVVAVCAISPFKRILNGHNCVITVRVVVLVTVVVIIKVTSTVTVIVVVAVRFRVTMKVTVTIKA